MRHGFSSRPAELRDRLLNQRFHSRAQTDAANGLPGRRRRGGFAVRQLEARELIFMQPEAFVHFGDVVVLGGEPENRYSRHTPARNFPGHLDCRQRFVDRIRRTREKAHLLPGDDGDSAFLKPLQILPGFMARSKRRVLLAQCFGQIPPPLARKLYLVRVTQRCGQGWRMGEKIGDPGEILDKLEKELGHMGCEVVGD